jgi:hypothetical protein
MGATYDEPERVWRYRADPARRLLPERGFGAREESLDINGGGYLKNGLQDRSTQGGNIMGKKIRFWTGAAVGAMLQYFYDPQTGEVRRALLREQLGDRIVEVRAALTGKAARQKMIGNLRLVPLMSAGRFRRVSGL